MSTESFSHYLNGMTLIITTAIIAYPFLSFLLEKIFLNKWLRRMGFILTILVGYGLFFHAFTDRLFAILIGSLLFSYIVYHLIADVLHNVCKKWSFIPETVLTIGLLLSTLTIVALSGDFRISIQILERFSDGSYTFFPGYWDDMIQTSFVLSIILIPSKYFYAYWQSKIEEKRQGRIKKTILQKELIQAQLDALHAKVNPHFLYNSLNSIAGLALVDGEKTRQMALALSRFFRYSMNKEQTNLISVAEEAEMVETYLEIEKIRFGNRLNYLIEVDEESRVRQIPRLLLQPIVENCVKHGWNEQTDSIHIEITFRVTENRLTVSIKDSGSPFPDEFIPGYGIKSTYDKLELLFSGHYELEFIKEPEKEVRILIS